MQVPEMGFHKQGFSINIAALCANVIHLKVFSPSFEYREVKQIFLLFGNSINRRK